MSGTEETFPSLDEIAAEIDATEKGGSGKPPVEMNPPTPAEPVEAQGTAEPEPEDPPPDPTQDPPPEPAATPKNPEPALPLSRHKAILEDSRAARAKVEQELERARAERAELEAQLAAVRGETPARSELFERLRENMPPELVEYLEQQDAKLSKQDKVIATYESRLKAEAEATAERLQAEVSSAFAANADLQSWESGNAEAWALAKQYDAQLQQSPRWAGKPIADRFAAVSRLVRADLDLPVSAAPAAPVQRPQPRPLPQSAPPAPGSLTDLPGGATPTPQSSNSLLSTGDPLALAAMGAHMSERQLQEFLARAG